MAFNINPVHNAFTAEGTTSTHSSLVSPYNTSVKGFQGFHSESASSSHSLVNPSGYQYLLGVQQLVPTEGLALKDIGTVTVTLSITEQFPIYDGLATSPSRLPESLPLSDTTTTSVYLSFAENLALRDELFTSPIDNERLGIGEFTTIVVTLDFAENLGMSDKTQTSAITTVVDTVKIFGQANTQEFATTKIQLANFYNFDTSLAATIQINSLKNNLVGATAASGTYDTSTGTYSPNPFGASVFVQGVQII